MFSLYHISTDGEPERGVVGEKREAASGVLSAQTMVISSTWMLVAVAYCFEVLDMESLVNSSGQTSKPFA